VSPLKTLARKLVFPFFIKTGLVKLFATNASGNRLILMYHGVVRNQNADLSVNHLSADDFEKHIKYLSENFRIIPLQEIFNSSSHFEPDKKYIAITFDDGYENNYTNAFPVLKKYNVPATIFVVTKMLEDPDYILWYDLIDLAKKKLDLDFFKSKAHLLSPDKRKIIESASDWNRFKDSMKILNTSDKEKIIQRNSPEIKAISQEANAEYKNLLKVNQMKELIASGLIEIGSHTHHHPNLDEISLDEVKFEIEYSKKLLEQTLNYKVLSIAFPDGAYNDQIKQLSLDTGYKNLLAVDYKNISDFKDKHILPRFCISNTTTPESNFFQIFRSFTNKGF
jgi:peptidoglycan/xylan/chitin deacetylase (PgdA/CDA1 family)